jgi:hypothetical protein
MESAPEYIEAQDPLLMQSPGYKLLEIFDDASEISVSGRMVQYNPIHR